VGYFARQNVRHDNDLRRLDCGRKRLLIAVRPDNVQGFFENPAGFDFWWPRISCYNRFIRPNEAAPAGVFRG